MLFLYQDECIARFSYLHERTFKFNKLILSFNFFFSTPWYTCWMEMSLKEEISGRKTGDETLYRLRYKGRIFNHLMLDCLTTA